LPPILGKGLLIYPAEGLAALVCSIGAAVVVHFDRSKSASLPLHLAAIAAVLAFVVTRFSIAPHILSLRTNSADLMNVQNAFTLTRRWWELKAGLHAVTFACNTWALIALGR
jgi:hypothetical protein